MLKHQWLRTFSKIKNSNHFFKNKEKDEVKETHITLDIDDGNWAGVLNYIAHHKDNKPFIDIIKTLQTKYKTIEGKTKVALKKAYEGK